MTNIVVEGKCGIRVEVVLHSITEQGDEIITFLRDYPRIVHAEDLKHRMHSNSAASSRAIPSAKMAEQLTGMPVRFGKANPGMQDTGVDYDAPINVMVHEGGDDFFIELTSQVAWEEAKKDATNWSNRLSAAGYHKQVYNRLTEPFQMIRVLTTMTETANFYWLRDDVAADPTLAEVARCMREAHKLSKPQVLKPGEWHLPFVDIVSSPEKEKCYAIDLTSKLIHVSGDTFLEERSYTEITLEEAIKVSCARCAATSFRNENYGLEKSLQVYDRLVNGDKVHAGALEHCATPMKTQAYFLNNPASPATWEPGISHVDRNSRFWSGNFKGWVQWRKLVPNENYVDKAQQEV